MRGTRAFRLSFSAALAIAFLIAPLLFFGIGSLLNRLLP